MNGSERDQIIRELLSPIRTDRLHVAPYFRVMKPTLEMQVILRKFGFGPEYDPEHTPAEIQELLFDDISADEQGVFTFPSRTIVLGHSAEVITVPTNEQQRMRHYFISQQTGEMIPLTTNLGAPLIHPGSEGPQTYEIVNETEHSITINVSDLVCLVDIFPLSGHISEGAKSETFGSQQQGFIKLR